jgi:membrane protein implicated in regulation of membrane protease activity
MLTLTYVVFAVAGCGYVVVTALLGHLLDFGDSHAGDGGADGGDGADHAAVDYGVDGGGHGTAAATGGGGATFHFPFFSPLALATLFAALGAYGLIGLHGLGLSDPASLGLALPAAAATAYGVTYVGWRLIRGSRASTVIRMAQLTGARAEVTTPIPAGGVGEAVAMVGSQRYTAPAREAEGREIARGTLVQVVGMVGPTLVVTVGAQGAKAFAPDAIKGAKAVAPHEDH